MNKDHFEELKYKFDQHNDTIARQELEDYRVDNAVILAAGISKDTVYAPPKGLFLVDGVPIIERLICQLKEVDIHEIYIVVGYKKEMFFYLEEKYGVHLIGNTCLSKNNIYSLFLARKVLRNTYICACDYYYKTNPFSAYEFQSYHVTTYLKNAMNKFVVKTNQKGRIIEVAAGATEGRCAYGLAYFDKDFSDVFVQLLESEINNYRIDSLFWQEFFYKHIEDLDLYSRDIESKDALEFNDLRALRSINLLFVDSVSNQIVKNICEQLKCKIEDITYVDILDEGHSNITFKVVAKEKNYVYRFPGISSKNIVSREREVFSNNIANKLGIDKTLLFIDKNGHKLSSFVPDSHPLDPKNTEEMKMLAKTIRVLHDYPISAKDFIENTFNPIEEADRLLDMACINKDNLFIIFAEIRKKVHEIYDIVEKDHFRKAICHGNVSCNNCLITANTFDIIDWEFSGVCDIAFDYPHDYEFEENDLYHYLVAYYEREPSEMEYYHWLGYRAIHYWFYTCWAIYKESINEDCGNRLLVFYEACKRTATLAKRYLNRSA